MPEYLSPGVYIEEVPSSLRAIEGVSTSTAAFVGRARRGTVPGYLWPGSSTNDLPFTPTNGFVLSADPAPVFLSSYSEFRREFGTPLPIPDPDLPLDYGSLGWAAHAFFDNGGKRLYVARVVDPKARPGTLRIGQGTAYHLVRLAPKNSTTISFDSTRGISVGDVLTFLNLSSGQPVLGAPAMPAVLAGSAPEPFALKDGDQLTLTTVAPNSTSPVTIKAKPAGVTTQAELFAGLAGTTLQIRVGGASEPVQSIPFVAGDPFTPVPAVGATASQVSAVIARYATGLLSSVQAGKVVIETDVQGTSAQLTIIGGPVAALGLSLGPVVPPVGSSNVADLAHVKVAEIQALFPAGPFTVDRSPSGSLRFTSTATGSATSVKLDEGLGSGLLSRLGFGPVTTITSAGSTGVPPTVKVLKYDTQANTVTIDTPLSVPIGPSDTYAITTAPTKNVGPKFIARSPGPWSATVSVEISPTDRSPARVTQKALAGAPKVVVESVSSFDVGAIVEVDHNGVSRSTHQVLAIDAATRTLTIDPSLPLPDLTLPVLAGDPSAFVRVLEIDVKIRDLTGDSPDEAYRGMSWNQTAGVADLRRHYAWAINARSRLVWVQPPGIGKFGGDLLVGSEGPTLTQQPMTEAGIPMLLGPDGIEDFTNGDDGFWVGVDNGPGQRSGITSLIDLSEARLIAAPGKTTPTIQRALIDQCELRRYCFAILDGERDPAAGSLSSILKHRNLFDTSFAAYYQPWFTVVVDGQNRYLPPSGHMAGIYARVDNDRGVWKAPANETVANIVGLKTNYTTGEQDILNPRGVNLVRQFDSGGIRVWGARTLSSNADVRYINVRRTLIYIEASIDQGTQWVVFEPNSPETWVRVVDSVSDFLRTLWRSKALFGDRPEEAYQVRCDESTMTSTDIDNGRLVCLIKVAIVRPAEFVIFRIEQITTFGTAP